MIHSRTWSSILPPLQSNPAEPVETALRPVGLGEIIGHLDCGDPFRILEAEFRSGAQPEGKAEGIGDRSFA
jgi:hypothetical protein